MKRIQLLIRSKEKSNKIINVFVKHNIKFRNNFYKIENKEFKTIKDEIDSLDIGVSILRNPDYVIIKEKMNRPIPPVRYVTHKEFSEFKKSITDKVDALSGEFKIFKDSVNENFKYNNENFKALFKHLNVKQPKKNNSKR